MTTARTAGMALSTAAGFLLGTYTGLYIVLATVNWDEPFEKRMVLATVSLATLFAVAGGVIAAPDRTRMWRPMATWGVGVGAVSMVALLSIEPDPVLLILVGSVEVVAIVSAAHFAAPRAPSRASSDEGLP